MASTLEKHSSQRIETLLRSGEWDQACGVYERDLDAGEKREGPARLAYAIALIRAQRERAGIALMAPDLLALPNARTDLRRYVVSPLVDEKRFDVALKFLDLLAVSTRGYTDD